MYDKLYGLYHEKNFLPTFRDVRLQTAPPVSPEAIAELSERLTSPLIRTLTIVIEED